ncbi:hypothetical protein GCM10027359_17230 [Marilutibacter aestuarii]
MPVPWDGVAATADNENPEMAVAIASDSRRGAFDFTGDMQGTPTTILGWTGGPGSLADRQGGAPTLRRHVAAPHQRITTPS